ncbi:MAG: aromatic ring hydroxylase [Candidatus Hecatellales archaeon ex4484_218]|nr:MAG: aromatic ring hydroxylase [Candidatus Hecatellales archaeon ex4484_218]
MRTREEFIEGLKKMKPNVWMGGEKVRRDDPRFQSSINVLGVTFDLANDPRYEKLFTATSHLTGKKINRFNHIVLTPEDLLKKQMMIRVGCHRVAGCIQRCMGMDAVNALYRITYEIDQKHGTHYHKNFVEWLKYFQENDLVGSAAQTDPKGDRSKRPHEQADPDVYLRVVEKRKDGIIVRGAKIHNTTAPQADEIIVIPTRVLVEGEEDYAVAFAVPGDWDGVKIINHQASVRPRKQWDAPIAHIGVSDGFVVFDDVFVPWERVFMCGEREFGGPLALQFAFNHRHSYTGCKPAVSDIIMGSAALFAEYNGTERVSHIREKISDLIGVAELVYSAGVASAVFSIKTPSGFCAPNPIYVNVGRRHAGRNIYHEYDILADIAGGIPATLPYEEDFLNSETKPFLEKYLKRKADIPVEDQHRCIRMLSDMLCSGWAGVWQVAGVHGGGSPMMETVAILGNYPIQARKEIAKYLAGIKSKDEFENEVEVKEVNEFLESIKVFSEKSK